MHGELRAGNIQVPETALLQKPGVPGGIQISTISGIDSTPLFGENGRIIGRFFEDSDAKYCVLGDVRPTNPQASRGAQTTDVLHAIQRALTDAGLHFRNVVRTWFYNDDILDWYAEFNQARTAFFQQHGITLAPASTGIGVSNAGGATLVAKAIAVEPKTPAVTVRRVDSPLQREASAYGSAFSRAMEVADRAGRILYISGTASVLPSGETAHTGNIAAQIEKTMEVVEAILTQNGMSFSDSTRAIAYFRRQEHLPLWEEYCRSRQLPPLPVILTECDICRDDLLFEIELDAARKNQDTSQH
jgi:enamine deaminase RidA (YjgF/YER057c/UK114 family)